ncbi:MAG: histidinol dehydrogenase [Planctomycetes bacterium]|nr:histidinol dehydrogenase [Planctomycetota bacterium]
MIPVRPLRDYVLRRPGAVNADALEAVRRIVDDVRAEGDPAVRRYTKQYDGVEPENLEVSADEFAAAERAVSQQSQLAIRSMLDSVTRFHKQGVAKAFEFQPMRGIALGRMVVPFDSAGLYVPGGSAAYPSSVVMAAAPATVAGVKRLILCTPPGPEGAVPPAVLFAAKIAGVEKVFKIGGAQAIAAMAYGTQTVPRAEIIVGPGNKYVTAAKKIVSEHAAIDFLAGPTEILVLSDGEASPRFIAADLIAQAEHDVAACAVFVTTSSKQAEAVAGELTAQAGTHARAEIIRSSLQENGALLVAESLDAAIAFANEVAPEHLVIACRTPSQILTRIKSAGAVFLGEYAPVAAGDYGVGPNAILPTLGEARRVSGLSADTFLKRITHVSLTREGLESVAPMALALAKVEGLGAHQKSVEVRLGR